MSVLEPRFRAFLSVPGRYATIATIDPDGSPRQAVVWYALEDDDTILVNSAIGRRWPANLLRDPRLAMVVADGSAQVALRGTAEHLHDGAAAHQDIERLARMYETGDHLEEMLTIFRGHQRTSFRFRPRSVTYHP